MAKRGGLGRGLDALIPDRKAEKPAKKKKEQEEKAAAAKKPQTRSTGKSSAKKPVDALKALDEEIARALEEEPVDSVYEEPDPVVETTKKPSKRDTKPAEKISEEGKEENAVISMRISLVEPNRNQPRKYFDDDAINELADSVKQFGIIQPLLVQKKDDYYEIIAGERRWRAAQKAGLKEVPVIVKNFSNQEAVEVSLIENIQREDLNPIEEAKAYERLVKEYGLSQEAVAGRVSKSRSSVTNSMRLLKLEDSVQRMVETGELSEGHARALLGIPMVAAQKEVADKVVKEKLSVRQTEKMVREIVHPKATKRRNRVNPVDTAILNDLAEKLRNVLGTKVSILPSGKKGGKIEIEYYSDDELDRLYEMLHSVR